MISIRLQDLPCLPKCRVPSDQSGVPVPGFGPPVAQHLEGGHLFRCEVPSQEVHGVFGEVRGDDWTHQVWTPITLQHLWTHTHTQWLCPLLSTLKAWNHAQRPSPSLLTPVRMDRERFGCDDAHNNRTIRWNIESRQHFPCFCRLINQRWHVSTSNERWNVPLQWRTYYATHEHLKQLEQTLAI